MKCETCGGLSCTISSSNMWGNITSYRNFTNICIPYFDKWFAEKKNLCPMGLSLLDCWTETEMPGNCKHYWNKDL